MRLPLRPRTPLRTPLSLSLSLPLSRSLSLCLAAAAPLLITATPPAHAANAAPACAAPSARTFPLTTRIHDGPDSYEVGGGYGTWYLDLTNTTTRRCTAIHPVVVLVDQQRALKPSQPKLEFYDGTRPRPHPVHFARTDEAELVGAFDDGFPGFTVDPGKTLTVKVRLALAPDAVANEITADAAVVQRHADDGDWIGQSNDYRFDVEPADPADVQAAPTNPATSPATPAPSSTTSPPAEDLSFTDELARTGIGTEHLVLAAMSVLLVTAGALLLARRRR
ncbi:LPXTG cell wall anchor domain-containing protein [Streptomyces sp. NPDC058469]|uniref:LPXTG cell wall anchor domain-containing protein n=1 Tax=Streptomyces sp. NPDC058469 TaxID=3346514 RepID=UPI0036569D40